MPTLPADYHTHTPLCRHATGEPEEYIDRAIERGVAEYGISDHAPQMPEPFDDWRMSADQLPEYFEWIDRARGHAGDKLKVRAGLECDWLPGNETWLEDLAARYPWDYMIGSIHYLGGGDKPWDFDNPAWLGRWAETDVELAWDTYWKEYTAMASSGLFDILGHPDLIKKFGYYPEGDLKKYFVPVIEAIAEADVAVELNMAGLHKPCEEAYPSVEFLTLAREAGIPITLSSDAHAPGEVAQDFEQGVALLKEAGYTSTCLFERRTRESKKL
ncbi:MAG: histidinol-phosphatase [Akkermansiaceae bacterium]